MHKYVAIGYAITMIIIFAVVALGRGAVRSLDGIGTLLATEILATMLLPAGVLLFMGARRSQGTLRKLLAYLTACLDVLFGLTGLLVAALILFGNARFHPA